MSRLDDFSNRKKTFLEVSRALAKMRQKVYSDGIISFKYKVLMALYMAIVDKCEPYANLVGRTAPPLGKEGVT